MPRTVDVAGGEHAVGYPLAKHALLGLDLVDVGGVEVAADAGVGVDVVLGDCLGEGRAVAQLHFGYGDAFH